MDAGTVRREARYSSSFRTVTGLPLSLCGAVAATVSGKIVSESQTNRVNQGLRCGPVTDSADEWGGATELICK